MKTALRLCALVACFSVAACDATRPGRAAYREGRFEDALAAFRDADDGSRAEFAWDRALAALRSGELDEAGASADEAAARDPDGFSALRDFLRGSVAFALCEAAEVETFRPGAGPAAFDPAIAHAESARRCWELAATSRADWPEARRNVERAWLAAARLAARKAEAARNPDRPRSEKTPRPTPAVPKLRPEPDAKETPAAMQETELARGEVLRLLERLAEKEQQKLDLRRAARRTQPAASEKDW